MSDQAVVDSSYSTLMAQLRPRLHRYCARMVGSVFEGEDVVQDALAKASEALASNNPIENPERWLFTIAHNTALDHLRRRKRQGEVPLDDEPHELASPAAAESWIAATASLATIMQLPVIQRSTVVLADVLEYSIEEIAELLGSTLPAVKAALHRGRVRLKTLSTATLSESPDMSSTESLRLRAYADSFNSRDFDTLRDLLAEDVKLDLVNRLRLSGRKDVSVYFGRYAENSDWKFTAGMAEDRPALFVSDPQDPSDTPIYVVLLEWVDGRILNIRDFRWAKYITDGLAFKRI